MKVVIQTSGAANRQKINSIRARIGAVSLFLVAWALVISFAGITRDNQDFAPMRPLTFEKFEKSSANKAQSVIELESEIK